MGTSGGKWSKKALKTTPNPQKEHKMTEGGSNMPFVGEYTHSLDAKNRLFIPAKFREHLGESFYITRKMNKTCLAVYSESEMERLAEKLNDLPDSDVADIKEFLFSKTILVTPDANGRVVLLPAMLAYAGI